MIKVKFLQDYENHKAGDVDEVPAALVLPLQEWAIIEVIEVVPVPAKKLKK